MANAANIRAGGAYVELLLKDSAYTRGLKQAEAQLAAFGKKFAGMGSALQSGGAKLMGLGGAAGAPLLLGAKFAADFEQQMQMVSTMLDEPEKHMDQFKEGIQQLSMEFGEDTAPISKGLYDILSASIAPEKALGVLRTAMLTAKAGMTDTGTAADVLTNILNAFHMPAEQASAAADLLFQTVKRGKTTLPELAEYVGAITATANSAGLSIDEMGAALATMTRNGLKTDVAVTGLQNILSEFLKPSAEGAEAAKKFGVDLSVAGLKTNGLLGTLQKLAKASPDLMAKIFPDVRGLRGILALQGDLQGFQKDVQLMAGKAGSMDAAYKKMTGGLWGYWNKAKQVAKAAFVQIGEAIGPNLKKVGDALLTAGRVTVWWIGQHKDAILTVGKWAAILMGAGAALWSVGAAVKFVGFGLSGLAALARVATMGFGLVLGAGKLLLGMMLALASPIGLVGAAIGGLVGYAAYASGAFQSLSANAGATWANIQQTATDTLAGIRDAMAAGDMQLAAEIAWAGVKVAWQTGLNWLYAGWLDFKGFFQRVWTEAVYKVASIGTTAWAGMKAGWVLVSSFFQQVWTSTVNGVKTAWSSAQSWISKAWIKGMKALGIYDEQTASGALAILEEEQKKAADNREAEKAAKQKAIEDEKQSQLAQIGQQEADSLAALDSAKAAEHANITAANNAALDASKDDLAAKKKALADLTAKSKTAAEEKRKKDEEEAKKTAATQGAAGAAAAQTVANAAKGAMAGTFNAGLAAMLVGVGMSGPARAPSAFGQPGAPASVLTGGAGGIGVPKASAGGFGQSGAPATVLTGGAGGIGVPKAAADQNSTLTPEAEKAAKENAKAKGLFGPGTQSAEEQLRQRRQAAIEAAAAEDPGLTFTGGAGGIGVPKRPTAPSAADINRAAAAAPAAVAKAAATAAPVAGSGVWDAIAANTASTVTKLEAIRLLLERGGGGSQPRYRR